MEKNKEQIQQQHNLTKKLHFIIAITSLCEWILYIIMYSTKHYSFIFILSLIHLLILFKVITTNRQRAVEYFTMFILINLFILTFLLFVTNRLPVYNLLIYIISICIYHIAEYISVLIYHYDKLEFASFLIDQSLEWGIAMVSSFIEYLIEVYFFDFKFKKSFVFIGLLILIVGHVFRIGALFTGKQSFTHLVSYSKKQEHILITNGVYSISRHPSYFGFYIWSVGSQIMLVNPICSIGFTIVLYFFFKDRILDEEEYLIQFFGDEYIKYQNTTPILIPFINLDEETKQASLKLYKYNSKLTEHKEKDKDKIKQD